MKDGKIIHQAFYCAFVSEIISCAYYTPSSQCFGTDMVYYIYSLLKL